MISLSDVISLCGFFFKAFKRVYACFFPKGIVIDFIEPFRLEPGVVAGGDYADCMPTAGFHVSLSLDAWNNDQNPHLLQTIGAELCGLDKVGWGSSCSAYEEGSCDPYRLPRQLQPGHHPIRLNVHILFNRKDAETLVRQLRRLKNESVKVKIVYTVKEGAETRTKKSREASTDIGLRLYDNYRSYLQNCSSSDRARYLLSLLEGGGL